MKKKILLPLIAGILVSFGLFLQGCGDTSGGPIMGLWGDGNEGLRLYQSQVKCFLKMFGNTI
jgi:hypothetical protein